MTQEEKDDILARLLEFDPLDTAERVTGKNLGDADTSSLGFALHMAKSTAICDAMTSSRDSHFGVTLAEFIALAEAEGFVKVLEVPFKGRSHYEDVPERDEVMYAYWKADEGVLLNFESHEGTRLNRAEMYYCWVANERRGSRRVRGAFTQSGHWADWDNNVWVGHADAREGFRLQLRRLRQNGTLQPDWPAGHDCYLWLTCYMDWRPDGGSRALDQVTSQERIAKIEARFNLLPADVQAALKGPRG